MKMLDDYNIHVALLQETLLPKHNINTPGYTPTKCECTNCQGIMTLVRNDVQAEVKNTPIEDIDVQKIDVWLDKKKVYNLQLLLSSKINIRHPTGGNNLQKEHHSWRLQRPHAITWV